MTIQSRPTELEQQVLAVLWQRGPSTVRDVLATLADGKQRAYTTVLTVLQGMEKKGLVRHKQQGLAHVFVPCQSREEVVQPLLKGWLKTIFGGQPTQVVQSLLDTGQVSPAELETIRELIEQAQQRGIEGEDQP